MRKLLLIFAATLLLASCAKKDDINKISIRGVERIDTHGVTINRVGLDAYINIDNPSGSSINILAVQGTLYNNGKKLATVRFTDKVKIRRKSLSAVKFPLVVEFSGLMGAMAIFPAIRNPENVTISVDATVRVGLIKKRIREEHIPLATILGHSPELRGVIEEQLDNFD